MFKFYVFADFSGKGLRPGGAVLDADDVRMREFDSYSDALCAAAVAYAMGANDVGVVFFLPKPQHLLKEPSKELSKQFDWVDCQAEGGHTKTH